MNLLEPLIRVQGFSLNLLEEIVGLQRKKESQEVLFSYLSNGTISLCILSHPPPFWVSSSPTPLHPYPMASFRKDSMLRLMGCISRGISGTQWVQIWGDPTTNHYNSLQSLSW